MRVLVNVLSSLVFRRFVRIMCLTGFITSGYYIFISDNYDLYWTYYVFQGSILLYLTFSRNSKNTREQRIPFKEKIQRPSVIFGSVIALLNLFLFIHQYNWHHSQVYIEQGAYEFTTEQPSYSFATKSKAFEDITATLERIRNTPTYPIAPDFREALLSDLAKLEGKSEGFVRAGNWERVRWKEGKPLEINLNHIEGSSPSNKGKSVGRIEVYPNGMATTLIYVRGVGFRLYRLDLSDKTLEYFWAMVGDKVQD